MVAAEAAALHRAGVFELLVGFHTSDVHRAVERALPPGARYVFTPPHEGGPVVPAWCGSASRRWSSTRPR